MANSIASALIDRERRQRFEPQLGTDDDDARARRFAADVRGTEYQRNVATQLSAIASADR